MYVRGCWGGLGRRLWGGEQEQIGVIKDKVFKT